MTRETSQLIEEAMKLPAEARAAIAGSLLESLEGPMDEGVEEAWAHEIERRLEELDSGKAKTIPWSEVRRQILHR